jgi:hypothetical protein
VRPRIDSTISTCTSRDVLPHAAQPEFDVAEMSLSSCSVGRARFAAVRRDSGLSVAVPAIGIFVSEKARYASPRLDRQAHRTPEYR